MRELPGRSRVLALIGAAAFLLTGAACNMFGRSAGALRSESIAWCWAVNGVFSVIASTLAAILSMSYGFRWVLLAALLFYAVAVLALRAIPLRPTITSG